MRCPGGFPKPLLGTTTGGVQRKERKVGPWGHLQRDFCSYLWRDAVSWTRAVATSMRKDKSPPTVRLEGQPLSASLYLGCQSGHHPLVQKPDSETWDFTHPRGCSMDPRPSVAQRTMSSAPGLLRTTACRRRTGMPGRSFSNALPPPPLDFGNA